MLEDILAGVRQLLGPVMMFLSPNEGIFIGYWAPSALLALFVYRRDRGRRGSNFLGFVTSWDALRSRSGQLDVRFFAVNAILCVPLVPVLAGLVGIDGLPGSVDRALSTLFVAGRGILPARPWGDVVLTVAVLLAADLAFYAVHYAFHRVPALWAFHKVHHSATALHPLTGYRGHPLNLVAISTGTACLVGLVAGVVLFLSPDATLLQIYGLDAIAVVTLAGGAIFRHSAVRLHFGPLNGILVSPAHHHIHHSGEARHWNRNLGLSLSVWDRLFGTYYRPDTAERFAYGLGDDGENARYTTLRGLYLRPFQDLARRRVS